MGPVTEARREEAERLRGYFDVQLLFAEAIAARTSRGLSDACLEFTNLHRRFGLGRADGGFHSPQWAHYAAELDRRQSRLDRLEWTLAFFAGAPHELSPAQQFGCFSYELLGPDSVVR